MSKKNNYLANIVKTKNGGTLKLQTNERKDKINVQTVESDSSDLFSTFIDIANIEEHKSFLESISKEHIKNSESQLKETIFEKTLKKMGFYEQHKSLSKIPNFITRLIIFIFSGLMIAAFEAVMIAIFGYENFQKYSYSIFSLIICIFVFTLLKFNYKVIILALTIFSSLNYLLYYVDELSSIYSQSFTFNLYTFSLTFSVILFIFMVEYFIFFIYILTSMLSTSIYVFYHYACLLKKIKSIPFLIVFVALNCYILSKYDLNDFYILDPHNITNYIKITLLYMCDMVFMIFSIGGFKFKETGNLDTGLNEIQDKLTQATTISLPIFEIFKNTNYYIGKMHENVEFMKDFSYSKLSNKMKWLFFLMLVMNCCSFYSYFKYYNSYLYDKSFFEPNNGYCSNMKNELIMKNNNSNDTVFIITNEKIENSYIYRKGKTNNYDTKTEQLYNTHPKDELYYIYEKKCEKII